MAKAFSVSVNIGGKVQASLGAAVRQANAMVSGLSRGVQAANVRTRSAIGEAGRGVASAGRKIQDAGRTAAEQGAHRFHQLFMDLESLVIRQEQESEGQCEPVARVALSVGAGEQTRDRQQRNAGQG